MTLAPILLLLALLTPPPLAEGDRLILAEAVVDGQPLRSDAGLDLLSREVAAWAADVAPADAFTANVALADPSGFRGRAFILSGLVRQSLDQPLGYDSLRLWTVMLEGEQPAVVFVHLPETPSPAEADIGQAVTLPVRFYKTAQCEWIVDASGQPQTVPILVGVHPVLADPPQAEGLTSAWPLLLAVLALAILVWMARRSSRQGQPAALNRRHPHGPEPGDDRPLPQDPAEALAELRRRGGGNP